MMSHLTFWSLLSHHPLKLHSEVVPTACCPANQNSPAALNSFHTYGTTTIRLLTAKYLQVSSAAPCRSRITASPHLAAHTLTYTPQKPSESSFKVSKVHTRVAGSFMFPLNQTGRQTAHFRPHHSCPELQSRAPGSRSMKCGENRSSCGKHVSTGWW